MTEFPSRRHEAQSITDAARSVAMVSLLGGHDIATADEGADEEKNSPACLLHEGAGVVVDLTETRVRPVLDHAAARCSMTVGVSFPGRGSGELASRLEGR